LELPNPGKAAALNAAARFVLGYPVVYLDADIRLTAADVERLVGVLGGASGRSCSTMAAAPSRDVDARQSTGLVRAYHRVLDSHPAYGHALFGRGAIALSELGRARFDAFPDVLADDFFLDSLFAPEEKVVVEDVASVVHAPRDTRALVRRLARVRRGNRQLRRSTDSARPVEGLGWLVTVVRQRPSMGPAAVAYLAITAAAELVAEWGPRSWGHDRSRGSLFEMRDPI
jgi:glycosyltransferase involved in cell wall biosynthesis